MAAALTPEQQEYVSVEIARSLALLADAVQLQTQAQFLGHVNTMVEQFCIEKAYALDALNSSKQRMQTASQAFEGRIVATIDDRIGFVTDRVTTTFVSESASMQATVTEFKVAMEGIGGDKFLFGENRSD